MSKVSWGVPAWEARSYQGSEASILFLALVQLLTSHWSTGPRCMVPSPTQPAP